MTISFEEARILVKQSSKYEHSLFVSRIMNILAQNYNRNIQTWILVGLLHDLDYDQIEDYSQHGIIASEQLADKIPDEAVKAIKSHDYRTGIKPLGLLAEALIFADSLALFLESAGEIKEGKGVFEEKPWLWSNLTGFIIKYDVEVLDLIQRLAI
jgi:predicted hydrolase (HD superfamily)